MIKAFAKLTAQEIFDKVAKHLLTQGKRSVSADGTCQYRMGELKCAAGCLIEEEEYGSEIEGIEWFKLVRIGMVERYALDLIEQLQDIHDGDDPTNWESQLKQIAKDRNLKWGQYGLQG